MLIAIEEYGDFANTFSRTILDTLAARLRTTWCHYLYLEECVTKHGKAAPSTAPCSPAPARRLVIVRDDIHPAATNVFLSFDGILSAPSASQPTAYERHSSLNSLAVTTPVVALEPKRASSPGRKRWSLLKSMFTSNNPERPKARASILGPKTPNATTFQSMNGSTEFISERTAELLGYQDMQSYNQSFKFFLEWVDRPTTYTNRDQKLYSPRLPGPAESLLKSHRAEPPKSTPLKPEGSAVAASTYAGRALAEWALVVMECQHFFERRRVEGVSVNKRVETPTLDVEAFRRPG